MPVLYRKSYGILRVDILIYYPVGTQHQNDVVSKSMRRDHVASTLIRHHFNVVCPLGSTRVKILQTLDMHGFPGRGVYGGGWGGGGGVGAG